MSVKLLTEHHLEFEVYTCQNATMKGAAAVIELGLRLYFMLNSTEHEISNAQKIKMLKNKCFSSFSDVVFTMLINVKMPTI